MVSAWLIFISFYFQLTNPMFLVLFFYPLLTFHLLVVTSFHQQLKSRNRNIFQHTGFAETSTFYFCCRTTTCQESLIQWLKNISVTGTIFFLKLFWLNTQKCYSYSYISYINVKLPLCRINTFTFITVNTFWWEYICSTFCIEDCHFDQSKFIYRPIA